MKKEYDFSGGVRGKFYRENKVQKTLRLDKEVLGFFQKMSQANGIPYQTLINLTLRKFMAEKDHLILKAS